MKHLILKRIVEYILLRHLSITKNSIEQTVDQLDFSLLHGVEGDEIDHLLLVGFTFFLLYFCNVPFLTVFYNILKLYYFVRSDVIFCKFAWGI